MSKQPPAPLPPSGTRALWERASELDRERTSPETGGVPLLSAAGTELSVDELLEVGREVGISSDSVLLSVAEGRLADGSELRPRRESPLWHRILVQTRDALEVSVHLPLPPNDVLRLMDEVMGRREYRMSLEDRLGQDSEEGSVSVYRTMGAEGLFDQAPFHGALHLSDGRVLVVAVVPDQNGGSRVRIRMPLYERGVNLTISGGAGIGGGAAGASLGTALGEAVAGAVLAGATGLLPLAVVVAPAVLGAYVGVGAGVLGFRRLQTWGFGKGNAALSQLARLLEMEAQGWRRGTEEQGDERRLKE